MDVTIAKYCYSVKQHIAIYLINTIGMAKKPINEVLADNLAHFMTAKGLTQSALGERCGVAQTTISLYLNPDRRKLSASGKAPSAKLSEVEMLAAGLGVDVWELLRGMTSVERQAYERIESAFRSLSEQIPSATTQIEPVSLHSHPALQMKKRIQPEKTRSAKAA